MFRENRFFIALIVVAGLGAGLLFAANRPTAANTGGGTGFTFHAGDPVEAGVSLPVAELPKTQPPILYREINPLRNPAQFEDGMGLRGTDTRIQDPLAALNGSDPGETPGLLFDFEGLGTDGFTPPDTVGDVGPNHYVQMVNVSFAIFDKSGTMLEGPTSFNDLFTGFGGVCETNNDGDPIVVYDSLADRWLLSQFADIFNQMVQCIAISTTPDPTGSYYLYAFPLPEVPDYPKIGVWPDGYYMGTNSGFPNAYYAHAFDREEMLAGDPATSQSFGGYPNFLMPADIDGPTAPPAGSPAYFYTYLKDGYPDHPPGVDRIEVYEFDVDWDAPGNSTFASVDTIPISAFNYTVCGFFVGDCIPQPGTGQGLDSLSYWPMWRMAYRNLGAYEAMVGNFTVDLNGSDLAAIRWFELRNSPSGWDLYQEGTFAPDSDHRWMGSIAMDGSGNIALGYSVSSDTTTPALRYTVRESSDPLGTLQVEESLIEGPGVQTGIHRWGDYSAMSVDPADECTFWFTSEYHDVDDSGFNWNTRVGVFKIPSCTGALGPDFTITPDPVAQDVCAPSDALFDLEIGSVLGYSDPVTLSALGTPAGTTTGFSQNPVVPPGMSTMTIGNTGSASIGEYSIDVVGVAPTSTHTATVGLTLYDAIPTMPVLNSPANGAVDVVRLPTFDWGASTQVATYAIEVADDAGFSNIVFSASGLEDTMIESGATLDPLTTYFWRVNAENVCGTSAYSSVFSFTTADIPPILLVDDDDDNPDVQSYWTGTLDALGLQYDVWETGAGDVEPDGPTISPYETILWFTGDRFGTPQGTGPAGPSGATESALAGWLDGGGCFFVSSQDYRYDKGLTGFMTSYLGVSNVSNDDGDYASVTGQNLLSGLGPYSLSYPYTDFSDPLTPGGGGEVILEGNNTNTAGVSEDGGVYKTVYWGFGLEALSMTAREETLGTIIDWCGVTAVVPDIDVSPSSVSAEQEVDTVDTEPLSIKNDGEAQLDWTIVEDSQTASVGGGWSDDFDAYGTGVDLNGLGGWKPWDSDPAFTAFTSGAQASSAPNSADILGDADLVHEYSGYNTGEWVYTAWMYIPGGFTGQTYFIMLNQYNDGGPYNWSTQVRFDSSSGNVINDGSSGGSMPYVTGEWIEIRVVIDLSENTQDFYYDDQLLYSGTWTEEQSGGGSLNLAAVDLFANGATSVYYDDMSLEQGAVPVCAAPDDVSWMSVSQSSGSTGAGNTTNLDLTLDTNGLAVGDYSATLCVQSNDPNESLVVVPVELEVTETAEFPIYLPVIKKDP